MLQPKTYPELVGKALVLEAEPFLTLAEDDNPWVEGLFLVTCVGVLVRRRALDRRVALDSQLATSRCRARGIAAQHSTTFRPNGDGPRPLAGRKQRFANFGDGVRASSVIREASPVSSLLF